MPRDILREIIDRRKFDMALTGMEFGFNVPSVRERKIHPFLKEKGAVLEVKRASPSKGDIAPDLDSYSTAKSYAYSGAVAISCLTETYFFKGTLGDLMNVCRAVDDFECETGKVPPAVLRKDFLLNTDEIEVSFRAGADAVLLIARILTKEELLDMAKKCEQLGISALIEVRKEEDLEKLKLVLETVEHRYITAGVNSRDLQDFTIDTLTPGSMLEKIKSFADDIKIVFESGILSPESAAFPSSMGFNAILLGEAAAKNPCNAYEFTSSFEKSSLCASGKSWSKYGALVNSRKVNGKLKKPFVKICGITNVEDAVFACEQGADFLGFVMWQNSRRNVSEETVRSVYHAVKNFGVMLVGVIADPEGKEAEAAFRLAREGVLDKIQFHGCSFPFCNNKNFADIPRYAAVNVSCESDLDKVKELVFKGEPRVLIDSKSDDEIGGTGKRINEELVEKAGTFCKLWLAGGIDSSNVKDIIEKFHPELIDLSSSVEKEKGIKDKQKLKDFFEALNKACEA